MPNIKFVDPELDGKKIELLGPIDNDSEDLAEREFITDEGSKNAIQMMSSQVFNRALRKWGMIEK